MQSNQKMYHSIWLRSSIDFQSRGVHSALSELEKKARKCLIDIYQLLFQADLEGDVFLAVANPGPPPPHTKTPPFKCHSG